MDTAPEQPETSSPDPVASGRGERRARVVPPGTDAPTGTDPAARYTGPGYEDVSFGQAVGRDAELAERLEEESDSPDEAERRFDEEAVGAPALERQRRERGDG